MRIAEGEFMNRNSNLAGAVVVLVLFVAATPSASAQVIATNNGGTVARVGPNEPQGSRNDSHSGGALDPRSSVAGQTPQQSVFRESLRAKADPRIPFYKPVEALSGDLTTIGSEWMDDLMKFWLAGFTRLYPNVHINSLKRVTVGAMGVEPALTEGKIQLAPASRELLPFEVEHFKQKFGYAPLEIRVGLGSYRAPDRLKALAIYVNASNPIKELTLAQLDAIYCSTRKRGYKDDIFTWGQLGLMGEWADREILPVGTQQPEGTGNYLRVQGCLNGEFKKNFHLLKPAPPASGLDRIVKIVAANPSAIGYGGFANIKPGSKAIALAEKEGGPYFTGTFEEVTSGKYPLARYIYITVNRAPGTQLDPMVKEFLKYVLSLEGQQIVEKDDAMLPLPAEAVEQERAKLN
jgi:phosphate transport system substrate-binding protein